jgi:cyanate permease
MEGNVSIRRGWLKAMYLYTLIVSGSIGLGMILFPGTVRPVLRFPPQDPSMFGLCGSLFLALGLVSALGLRFPLKFAPVLLLELVYKPIWLIAVALPVFLDGRFPFYVVSMSVIFVTFIIGDLIAIPFSHLFRKRD